jgi:hypothetical protein
LDREIRIQEIAQKLCDMKCDDCSKYECSTKDKVARVYNEILPEGSVVLSGKEYSELLRMTDGYEVGYNDACKEREEEVKKYKKNIAGNIFWKVKRLISLTNTVLEADSHSWQPEVGYNKKELDKGLAVLAKEFGVDITDLCENT